MREKRAGDIKEGDRIMSREGILKVARVDPYEEEGEVVFVLRREGDNAPLRFECSTAAMLPIVEE